MTQTNAETIPIGIRNFIGNYSGERRRSSMAAGVVSTLPVLIAFFATQRWLVRGPDGRSGEGMKRKLPPPPPLRVPAGFLWGAATAAYQIEGAAREDGRGESIWDRFSHTPARSRNGDTGDVACDHYHRWREDIDLMATSASRPTASRSPGRACCRTAAARVNEAGLDFYHRLVDGLLERGHRADA